MLGTVADVKKTIYDPCPYGYHMPPQDAWTNFTTVTTAYNTSNVTEYNVVEADKYNQTTDGIGFTDEKFEVWGRRFFTTGEAETADAGNVAFYPAAGYHARFDVCRLRWVGATLGRSSPYSATSQNGASARTQAGAPGGQRQPFECVPRVMSGRLIAVRRRH